MTRERVVLPPGPAPLAFVFALSVSVSSLRDKTYCESPFCFGAALSKMARVPSCSAERHLQSPHDGAHGSTATFSSTAEQEEDALTLLGMPR